MKKKITIQAPGRICLFGDHQDYLELPVIACAIDRSLVISAEENGTEQFHFFMPDIKEERTINIHEPFEILEPGDHMGAALKVVRRYNCIPNGGYDITITSTIPINAGTSSSSALVVAWTHFLLLAFGCDREITPSLIGQLAYEAEVVEHHSPGGKMDQFTIAMGDIVYIDTSQDFSVASIGESMSGLILGVSGIPKETIGVLSDLRSKAQDAIGYVVKEKPDFDLKNTTMDQVEKLSACIPKELQPYFYAAVKNHSITQAAYSELKKEKLNLKNIGTLMTAHHEVLRDYLKLTVPKIDAMIDAVLKAGAYGAKIVGSGGGGSMVAISPSEDKSLDIIKAIKEAGAEDAYKVRVSSGTEKL